MNAYRTKANIKFQLDITSENQLLILHEALTFYKRDILSRLTDSKKYIVETHDELFEKAFNLAELLTQLPDYLENPL